MDSPWKLLSFLECGENYEFNIETHEVRNVNTGRILKQQEDKGHHYFVILSFNCKKRYSIHQLMYAVHNKCWYDTQIYNIDHIDRNPHNNSIDNLRLVSRSVNSINRKHHKGKVFEYLDDIGKYNKIKVKDQIIYYSYDYNKFYRKVEHEYREFHEKIYKNERYRIEWHNNNKRYWFNTTQYRMLNGII